MACVKVDMDKKGCLEEEEILHPPKKKSVGEEDHR